LRPHRKQRLTVRVENLGFLLERAIVDFLAIPLEIKQSVHRFETVAGLVYLVIYHFFHGCS